MTVSLDVLICAIEMQKKTAQWTKDNGQFIPHPATWLNSKRWEDTPIDAAGASESSRKMDDDEIRAIQWMMGGSI